MTRANNVNQFFKREIYPRLSDLAWLPIGWSCKKEENPAQPYIPDCRKLLLATALSPLLVPATIGTGTIACGLGVAAVLCNSISCCISAELDRCLEEESEEKPPMP